MTILPVALLTVSDSRSLEDDPSGDLLRDSIVSAGHRLMDRFLVRDDVYAIRAQVSNWIADPSIQVIITTGGTGFTGRASTPSSASYLLLLLSLLLLLCVCVLCVMVGTANGRI